MTTDQQEFPYACPQKGCDCVYSQKQHLHGHINSKHAIFCTDPVCSGLTQNQDSNWHLKRNRSRKDRRILRIITPDPSPYPRRSSSRLRGNAVKQRSTSSCIQPGVSQSDYSEDEKFHDFDSESSSDSDTNSRVNPFKDVVCEVCKSGNLPTKLLICDNCGKNGRHIHCFQPKLRSVPKDDWFCAFSFCVLYCDSQLTPPTLPGQKCLSWFEDFLSKYG